MDNRVSLWNKRTDESDIYTHLFIAGDNDDIVNDFCDRLLEYLRQSDTLSDSKKTAFVIDFDHQLTRIRQLTIETVSKVAHDRLVDTLAKFRKLHEESITSN